MNKVHYTIIFAISFLICITLKAQISDGGTPPSFNFKNLSAVPVVILPPVDLIRLNAEDAVNDKDKSIPWRFGDNIFTNLSPDNSGVFDMLKDGDKLWRLGIKSKGAVSINLAFNKFHLPKEAKVFIYNEDKSFVLGAFTDFNNQKDNMFATTLIPGESIIIEYYEPKNAEFKGELTIWRVTHAYRGPYYSIKGFGTSDTCQRNAVCPEGYGWGNQIQGECMLVTNGNAFCSGTLINNTSNNGTPYVITANHCYSDPSTWVFWFNWKSANCTPNTPPTQPNHNDISGATLKAKNAATDFCLVQMNNSPPENYNIYYVGWNRSSSPATSAMCIHHPDGDITKISRSITLRDTFAYNINSWKARWIYGPCTEPGSSGSPIYDQNHLFVGQLYGGPSACGLQSVYMWDVYGKFSVSWEGGGTSSTRLKDWLDPTNSNANSCDGYDPTAISTIVKKSNIIVNVFPNPNSGKFTLEFESPSKENTSFELINLLNVCIYRNNDISIKGHFSENLNFQNLPDGVYFLKVKFGDNLITKKIIIQK